MSFEARVPIVGIGTTSPTYQLQLTGASSPQIAISSTGSGGRIYTLQSTGGSSTSLDGNFAIIDRTAGLARMSIDSIGNASFSGNVGMGTTSPTASLAVLGQVTTATPGLSVIASGGGSSANWYDPNNFAGYIMNSNNSAQRYGLLISDYWRSSENYLFTVDGRTFVDGTLANDLHSPYFVVRGNGNVGIGTSNPQAGLDVATPGTAGSAIIVPRDTSVNRPTTAVNGMIRYNTTNSMLEGYVNGTWQDFSTAATGAGYLPLTGGTLSGALTVAAGGVSVTGGINDNNGAITNVGNLSGNGTINVTPTNTATSGFFNYVSNNDVTYNPGSNPGFNTNVNGSSTGVTTAGASDLSNVGVVGVNNYAVHAVSTNLSSLIGASNTASDNAPGFTVAQVFGTYSSANHGGAGFVQNLYGTYSQASNGAGTATNSYAFYGRVANSGGATNGYGLYLGTISATNKYGIYQLDSSATNFFAGNMGIGVSIPQAALDVASTGTAGSAIIVPRDSSANRPTTAVNGMIRYNTTNAKLEGFVNGSWQDFSTTATGGSYLSTSGGTLSGALTVAAGGESLTGGLNNNSGGITNAGNISGVGTSLIGAGALIVAAGGTNQNLTLSGSGTGNVILAPNVGIGTTNPTHTLDIVASDSSPSMAVTNLSSTTARYPSLLLANYTGGFGGQGGINFASSRGSAASPAAVQAGDGLGSIGSFGQFNSTYGNSGAGAALTFIADANFSATSFPESMVFSTAPVGSTTMLERMRVNSSGNVGIGTSLPNATLDVNGGAHFVVNYGGTYPTFSHTSGLAIGWNGSGLNGETDFINFPGSGNGGFSFVFANNTGTVTSTPVVIAPTGKVGIGTTNPGSPLSVVSTSTSNSSSFLQSLSFTVTPSSNNAGTFAGVNQQISYNGTTNNSSLVGGGIFETDFNSSGNGGSVVGMQGTVITAGAGTIANVMGANGTNSIFSGTVVTSTGSNGLSSLSGGVATKSIGVYGESQNQGGAITSGYGGKFAVSNSSGTTATGYGVYVGNVAATTKYSLYASDSTAPSYFAANIGIGTTTPQASLDVVSNGTAGSAIIIPRDTSANRPTTAVNGMIRYNTTNSKLEGYVNGSWQDFSTAATGGSFLSSSGGTISGALTVAAGGESLTGGLNNNSGGITNVGSITGVGSTITGAGALTIAAGGANQNLTLSGSGTGKVLMTPNVGIGTATPGLPLDVEGAPGYPVATGGGPQTAGVTRIGSSQDIMLDFGTANANPYGFWMQTHNLANSSTFPLLLNPNGGMVGVGTTSPTSLFTVNGVIQGKGLNINQPSNPVALIGPQSVSNDYLFLQFDTGINAGRVGTGGAYPLRFDTASAEAMRIDATGKVGIGTSVPSTPLHVNGQILGGYVSGSSATISWLAGNVQKTSVAAPTTLNFTPGTMFDGGNYTLVLTGTAGTYTLGVAGDITTWKCSPACAASQITTSGETVLTIIKVGSTGYVSWVTGF